MIGRNLKGGEVIELVGDVGAGKTEFVRGLARGFGSEDKVSSPTFTISRIYSGPNNLRINHFDFYRLQDPGIIAAELDEVVGQAKEIVAIEWSDVVKKVLPDDRLEIRFSSPSVDKRKLELIAGDKHTHLIEGLDNVSSN